MIGYYRYLWVIMTSYDDVIHILSARAFWTAYFETSKNVRKSLPERLTTIIRFIGYSWNVGYFDDGLPLLVAAIFDSLTPPPAGIPSLSIPFLEIVPLLDEKGSTMS